MADSTTNIPLISASQAQKEVLVNGLLDAASPAMLYGRNQVACAGLTWGYFGGKVLLNGVVTSISNGTLTLTASVTNYIEADPQTGAVSFNSTGFTAGKIPLYSAVTGTNTVTSYTDYRLFDVPGASRVLAKSISSDANVTLSQVEARAEILHMTSSATLTVTRNVVVPLTSKQIWTVYNGTTGGQSIQFIGGTGTGITVANGKHAIVRSDGTNVVRVTADT